MFWKRNKKTKEAKMATLEPKTATLEGKAATLEAKTATFDSYHLHPLVMKGIQDAGFTQCTPVQEQALQHSLQGSDLMVQSQTGTGKTAAFLITILHRLLTDESMREKNALIIAPTRELVVQIEQEARLLGKHTSFGVAGIIGGMSYKPQRDLLSRGARIIVGTPGRLLDLSGDAILPLDRMGIVVIDEADRMFDMGFYPEIRRLLRQVPPHRERLTMLYSATLSTRARNLAWEHMTTPVEIEITTGKITVDQVDQTLYHIAGNEKFPFLLGYIIRNNPTNALIFTNTKRAAEMVSDRLNASGFGARYIIGDLPQKKRLGIIEELKGGTLRFLVATDVAARGLHVDDLQLVVNYDLPEDSELYVHRVGRTARAGRTGQAISLACEKFVYGLNAIERFIEMKIPIARVDEEDLAVGKRSVAEAKRIAPRDGRGSGSSGRNGGRRSSGGRSNSGRSSSGRSSSGRSSSGRNDSGRSSSERNDAQWTQLSFWPGQ